MKKWVRLKELVGQNGFPSSIQGVTQKAKREGWERRRVENAAGKVYEYCIDIDNTHIKLFNDHSKRADELLNENLLMVLNQLTQDKQALLAKSIINNGVDALINYSKSHSEHSDITKHHLMIAKELSLLHNEVVREIFDNAKAKKYSEDIGYDIKFKQK